jgi:hypothetical protein
VLEGRNTQQLELYLPSDDKIRCWPDRLPALRAQRTRPAIAQVMMIKSVDVQQRPSKAC